MKNFSCRILPWVLIFLANTTSAQAQIKFEGSEAYIDPEQIVVKEICRPEWPLSSLRNSEMGTVELLVMVSAQGLVTRTKLVMTSGFRDLDRATMRGFIGCKFKPIEKDGVVVASWFPLKYIWKIEESK